MIDIKQINNICRLRNLEYHNHKNVYDVKGNYIIVHTRYHYIDNFFITKFELDTTCVKKYNLYTSCIFLTKQKRIIYD